jgi:regulator of sirC expression with transglutaminase-like and TPR domain
MSSASFLLAPSPMDYFATLVAEDTGFPLLEAAIAVAQDEDPQLDVQGVLADIDELGQRLRQRLPADAAPLQRMRLLNTYFFRELGFAGNVNDYYDRRNSLLPSVVATRRGIPITLALIYIELASLVGVKARGVSFPGHFLVKLSLPRGEVVIDPFSGRSLGREELEERLLPYRSQRGTSLEETNDIPLGLYLQAAHPRDVLARLLRNLKEVHRAANDHARLAAVQQRLVILLPREWDERRDWALALHKLGRDGQAARELAVYLEHRPDAPDAPELRRELSVWQSRGDMPTKPGRPGRQGQASP